MSEVSLPLYLNENVRVLLAQALRNRGYDVCRILEIGRTGKSDSEQFVSAVRHKTAILTHNSRGTTSSCPTLMQNRGKNIKLYR
jgi:hypothetical protein